jgi:hypothetical protein
MMARHRSAALALLGMICAAPAAQAAAPLPPSCLDLPTLEAARVHQFQTMMMAVSLRCRAHGVDVESSFSRMMAAHRATFAAADRVMHGYVTPAHGFAGAHAFDSYATVLANRYGGGATSLATCGAIDGAMRAVTADASGARLHGVALAMIGRPEMDRLACAATSAKPAAPPATALALASPAPAVP